MKRITQPAFSAITSIVIVLAIFLPGCGGTKHDCQQAGHEWVTGRSGEVRCNHCGVYQPKDTNESKTKE